MILVLDRGNRALKAALFDSGRIVRRWRDEGPKPEQALKKIVADSLKECPPPEASAARGSKRGAKRPKRPARPTARECIEGVAFASVVPAWTKKAVPALRRLGIRRILPAGAGLTLPFSVLIDHPERVGSDRLAAAAGVVAFGGRDAVIVDAGSAVTVDVLAGGAFLGGAIFPGSTLVLEALHDGTAALPRIALPDGQPRIPGRDTEGAMRAGAYFGLIGAVKELTRRSLAPLSEGTPVWVTGAGGEALAQHLGADARWEPDLVSIGLHYLFKLNVK